MSFTPSIYRRGLAYCGVYMIVNLYNERFYVGSTIDFVGRFSHHKSRLLNGNHQNESLQNDFDECGLSCFLFKPIITTEISDRKRVEYSVIFMSNIDYLYNSINPRNHSLFEENLSWVDVIKRLHNMYNQLG